MNLFQKLNFLKEPSLFQKKINLSNFFRKKRVVKEIKAPWALYLRQNRLPADKSGSQQIITDIIDDTVILVAPDVAQHRGLLALTDIVLRSLLRQREIMDNT